MTHAFNPYSVLGVQKDASPTDITTAYNALKGRLEPAKDAAKPGASAQLEQIEEAYSLLNNQARRRDYDRNQAPKGQDAIFSLRVTPSKRTIERLQEPQVVYLLVEILPGVRSQSVSVKRDAGLNLTLVLDHSNSMNGIRMDRVKVAASEIINQLSENDILSVVSFNDRAEVVIPATPVDNKSALMSRARMMRASGGTEMYQGLSAGVAENRKNRRSDRVNHIILLTDGNTYGDQDKCLKLARKIADEGISVSTLGLGSEWNDEFLDEIASLTGGSSGFIKSASAVVSFLNNQVQSLSNIFAERLQYSIAPEPDIDVEMMFKLAPSPQPLPEDTPTVQLGGMQFERPISTLLQLQIPANSPGNTQRLGRIVVSGNIMVSQRVHTAVSDVTIDVTDDPVYEDPPNKILDALGKLTLYRMQERANKEVENGNIREATQQLQNLATRLIEVGQDELAKEAFEEAKRLEATQALSEEGRKTLKYQTRLLINQGD